MIQLDWGSSRNIDRMYILGYNIYYRRENDTREEMLFIEGNRNKQFLIGLGRDETYYLRIATLTTWGFEASSQWIRIQKHPHEFLPPAPPKDIKAVTSVDAIRVTWTPSRDPESRKPPLLGYRLIYGPVDKPSEVDRVELDPRADRFSIRGLNDSTLYIIQLRAFNKYTMSDPMYVRAATKALPPSTVINARAVALSSKEIHVHWNRPARGHVTKYQLRYWRPGKRDKQSAWLQAPTADYVAGSLKKFSSYRFEIIPFAGDVIGEGSVIFADTLASKPDAPPRDVTVKTINATHLMVTWKPPPEGAQNGEVTGYKVIMKKKGGPRLAKFSVDADRYNYTFKDLKPGSTYKVRMAAINNNGTGPFTDWVVGRTDTIEMRQPEGPQWLKLDVTSHSVVVTWSVPRDIGVPVLGYIVGYGRYIPEVYRHIVGPGQRSFVIEGLKPETEYIVSVRAFNHMGESVPQFAVVHTLSAPPVLALEVPVKLRVLPLSPTHMALSWLDPALLKRPPAPPPASPSAPTSLPPPPPSDGRVYLIRYSAISGEEYQYLNATTTSLNVSGLDVATTYEFAVRTTRDGEKSGWSLPVVNTTQQTAPSSAPSRVTVLALPSSPPSLQLNWSQPAFPNGHITGKALEVGILLPIKTS
ncbi:neogenin-like [Littorina saxatilis]|uniref:neogenin-like n=1 Tax=Littorina saxatilis TaxID=31220 RepID=UPI0038B626BC